LQARSNGKLAEDYVADKLLRQGWNILVRNFRHIGTELDIVAEKESTLVVIEVKHRKQMRSHDANDFASLLTHRKKQSLQKGVLTLLPTLNKNFKTIRFDLALVEGDLQDKSKRPSVRYMTNILA